MATAGIKHAERIDVAGMSDFKVFHFAQPEARKNDRIFANRKKQAVVPHPKSPYRKFSNPGIGYPPENLTFISAFKIIGQHFF
jgi:hypothetical protein